MRSYRFVIERRGRGSADRAFALIRDAEHWKDWAGAPIAYSAWREQDWAAGDFVGRTRLVGNSRFPAAEVLTVDDPATRTHAYRIPAEWPVRDYRSTVTFTPDGQDVVVRWAGEFVERIPGTGLLWRAFLNRFLGRLAERLIARSAE